MSVNSTGLSAHPYYILETLNIPVNSLLTFEICDKLAKLKNPLDQDHLNKYLEILGTDVVINWDDYVNAEKELNYKNRLKILKEMRDIALKDSDWVLTYDNVQTLANLEEWINYRQKLRDLFLNISDIYSMKIPLAPRVLRK